MLYGLRTIEDGIIFRSHYLSDVFEEMKKHPTAFVVEIEEPKLKKNYFKELE